VRLDVPLLLIALFVVIFAVWASVRYAIAALDRLNPPTTKEDE
jgi:hypothetical protein